MSKPYKASDYWTIDDALIAIFGVLDEIVERLLHLDKKLRAYRVGRAKTSYRSVPHRAAARRAAPQLNATKD